MSNVFTDLDVIPDISLSKVSLSSGSIFPLISRTISKSGHTIEKQNILLLSSRVTTRSSKGSNLAHSQDLAVEVTLFCRSVSS